MSGTTVITSWFRLFLALFLTKTRINFLQKALRSKDSFYLPIYLWEKLERNLSSGAGVLKDSQYKSFTHCWRNWSDSNFTPASLWAQLFWCGFKQGRFCWLISMWGFLNVGEAVWSRSDCHSQRFGFRSFSYQCCLWDLAAFCVGSPGMDFSLRMNVLQMGCGMTEGLKIQTKYLLEVNSVPSWNLVCKT